MKVIGLLRQIAAKGKGSGLASSLNLVECVNMKGARQSSSELTSEWVARSYYDIGSANIEDTVCFMSLNACLCC